jgi:hypothetical protein
MPFLYQQSLMNDTQAVPVSLEGEGLGGFHYGTLVVEFHSRLTTCGSHNRETLPTRFPSGRPEWATTGTSFSSLNQHFYHATATQTNSARRGWQALLQ